MKLRINYIVVGLLVQIITAYALDKRLSQFAVPFDLGMDFAAGDTFNKRKNPVVNFCRKLYKQNNVTELVPQEKPLIPKIIHCIWVGPKTPPLIFKKCLESVKKYHPGWECKVWTDKEVAQLKLYNQEFYDQTTNYAEKADILRYELLYLFGGVYLDVDFICLQPLDLLVHTYDFFTCLCPCDVKEIINNAVIGSAPKHPIVKDCIKRVKDDWLAPTILERVGPTHFTKSFYRIARQSKGRVIALPKSFFYPLNYESRGKSFEESLTYAKPESFAIHYWAGTWL